LTPLFEESTIELPPSLDMLDREELIRLQQPVYRMFQHPPHLAFSSSARQSQVVRPPQGPATNAGSENFKMVWTQLQQGQKPVTTTDPHAGRNNPRPTILPPGSHVNGHVLAPPPSWLKQQAAGASAATTSQTDSKKNICNPVTHQKPTTDVLSELFKSAKIHDRVDF